MALADIVMVLRLGLLAILGLLALAILRGLFNGEIKTAGLLRGDDGAENSPERLVLLVSSVGYSVFYVLQAIGMQLDEANFSLPEIPEEVLVVLAGTNGLYLTKKISGLGKRGN